MIRALDEIANLTDDKVMYEIYRAACVKEFELVLEQSGKLLRKYLAGFYANHGEVDRLRFKDVFRQANRHCLLDCETVERWLAYRDHRNITAHDYGVQLTEATLSLLPQFTKDALFLADLFERSYDD